MRVYAVYAKVINGENKKINMDIIISLAIVSLAALVHSSFQLSLSVLTLLSGHTLSAKKSHAKLLRSTASFIIGVFVMTSLMLSAWSLFIESTFDEQIPQIIWTLTCGLLIGVALAIWMFYYRQGKGTSLWIPRSFARYLVKRTTETRMSAEAFGLGVSSVIGETLFIIAPLTISALAIVTLPDTWRITGVAIYAIIATLPLGVVWMSIGGGHKISQIQSWREKNKHFMQFAAGAGLLVLAFFVYANEIASVAVGGL